MIDVIVKTDGMRSCCGVELLGPEEEEVDEDVQCFHHCLLDCAVERYCGRLRLGLGEARGRFGAAARLDTVDSDGDGFVLHVLVVGDVVVAAIEEDAVLLLRSCCFAPGVARKEELQPDVGYDAGKIRYC